MLERADVDPSVGAIVLRGARPRAFSAGADLKHATSLEGAAKRRFIESCWKVTDQIEKTSLPVVAVLHGHVLGGGLELALACDMRIASSDANFALPEILLGSVPAFGAMQRLARVIGVTAAAELTMDGAQLSAEEASRLGLLNAVTEPGAALEALQLWPDRSQRTRVRRFATSVALRGRHGRARRSSIPRTPVRVDASLRGVPDLDKRLPAETSSIVHESSSIR
ncbi:enoyl-CoA hydratase/isomerase family protein [Yinghuangia aomiensis]